MTIGERMYADCSSTLCLPDVDVSQIVMSASITATGSTSGATHYDTTSDCGAGRCPSYVVGGIDIWKYGSFPYTRKIDISNTTTMTATWDLTSTSDVSLTPTNNIVSGGLKLYRLGTNVVLQTQTASGPKFRCKKYTFTQTANGVYKYSPGERYLDLDYPLQCRPGVYPPDDCCGDSGVIPYDWSWYSFRAAAQITDNQGLVTVDLYWLNVAEEDTRALDVSMTATGATVGPWTIEVKAGVVTAKSATGITITTSGTINDVMTALTAGGYLGAGLYGGTTYDVVSTDFKDSFGKLTQTGCSIGILLAYRGEVVSPRSGQVGFAVGSGLTATTKFFSDYPISAAFPNTEEGFLDYATGEFKINLCQCGGSSLYLQTYSAPFDPLTYGWFGSTAYRPLMINPIRTTGTCTGSCYPYIEFLPGSMANTTYGGVIYSSPETRTTDDCSGSEGAFNYNCGPIITSYDDDCYTAGPGPSSNPQTSTLPREEFVWSITTSGGWKLI